MADNEKAETTHDHVDSVDKRSITEQVNEKAGATVLPPETQVIQDGGTRAWLQVVGSFLVFGNIWGFPFAYGTFQNYYELTYLPHEGSSNISWVGTITTFLLIVTGVVSGPLFDLGYYKTMLFTGAAIETFGLFMLSLCDKYWQILITQGIVIGLGNGFLYLPGLALVGRSFKRHRAIAMGITSCGAPTGGVIYTLVFEQLIGKLGFSWTVRVMGFLMLGTYLLCFPLLLWGAKNVGDIGSGTTRKLFDPTALRDLPFWSYTVCNFFLFMGYMVPFFYMPSFAQLELGMTRSMALYSTMVAQALSICGRMVASYAATRIGVMIPWLICGTSSAILCLGWIGVHSRGAFYGFAALYGCFSGALIPLPPSIFPVVCPDYEVLGARMGMAQAVGSIASLIGSPIAGALSQVGQQGQNRNYLGLQLFSGLAMLAGGCQLIGLWALLIKRRSTKKLI